MTIFEDIMSVLASLSFIDYVLYLSVLALIVLTAALVYVLKNEKEDEKQESPKESLGKEEELDLQQIMETIDENPKPLIDMTSYEQEQEQKAIISYEELVKESQKQKLNYEKEELVDKCIPVKKIDLNHLTFDTSIEPKPVEAREDTIFHYEREEAFLKSLQELNELLN